MLISGIPRGNECPGGQFSKGFLLGGGRLVIPKSCPTQPTCLAQSMNLEIIQHDSEGLTLTVQHMARTVVVAVASDARHEILFDFEMITMVALSFQGLLLSSLYVFADRVTTCS